MKLAIVAVAGAIGARRDGGWVVDQMKLETTLILALALVLTACDPIETPPARAEARIALFKQCMELAAKMPRQADDDVSDVVQECSNQAWYMTNYIK